MNQRVINRLAATAALALVAAAGQAQVFSTSPFVAIPEPPATFGTVSSTLDVSGAPTLTDLNVIIDITHTFTGDLDIILVPPSGDRYIHLTSDNGGLGDNYTFTRFDQSSPLLISAGVAPAIAPFNGTFAPEGGDIIWRAAASIPLPGFALAGLDDFIGTDPNGTWTLIIDDDAGGDIGTLNYWSLEVNGAIDPQGPALGTPPIATGAADPTGVPNDGTGVTTLTVTVTPGSSPTSTFASTGSVTVDGSAVGLSTITLLDNGVSPDQVAGDFIFSGNATIPADTVGAQYVLPYDVTDDQGRSATGNINITVTAPPPPCAPGAATLSFTGVQSDGAVGTAGNSVVTGDFGLAGNVNQITVTGRFTAIPASYRSEARIRLTAPSGNVYDIGPFTGAPLSAGVWDISGQNLVVGLEDGTGTWSFEFWESFNDFVSPDAIYDGVCFTADLAPTNPSATDAVAPAAVNRDGAQSVTLSVTVTPGAVPASTNLTVVVDDSAVGGSGSLSLLDNGVAPDLVAGDNVFTGAVTVAYNTPLGINALPYTVSDSQGRSFADALNFTVTEATGACCTSSGCVVTTVGDCIDAQGGTFAGNATACVVPVQMTTQGAGAFEDISLTGTIPGLEGVDDGTVNVTLPFPFTFFGAEYTSGNISSNGNFQFGTNNSTSFTTGAIPSAGVPNNALYVLWDDLDMDLTGFVFTETRGTPGVDERFIIQWNNVGQYNLGTTPLDANTFQIVLFPDGNFEFRYQTVNPETTAGDLTIIGFEDISGTSAVTLPETRDSLSAQTPISFRGNSLGEDTGVCGGGSTCPACPADYDQDGGVTGADIAAFFADFEAGAPCADTDQDGGVTGGDIGAFFAAFEAGGC